MFWYLILSVTTANTPHQFAIDRFNNIGDCYSALQKLKPTHYYDTHVVYSCEKRKRA